MAGSASEACSGRSAEPSSPGHARRDGDSAVRRGVDGLPRCEAPTWTAAALMEMGMDPKGMYSIGQLAQLAGLSRFQMRRLLVAHGVSLTRTGRKDWVMLLDLKEGWPRLWATLVECEAIRPLVRRR